MLQVGEDFRAIPGKDDLFAFSADLVVVHWIVILFEQQFKPPLVLIR